MATIKLQGNASGSGSVTLTAPNTNSARTITLPDQDVDFGNLAGAGSVVAWVNFNGTGTVAIRDSGNVSSITDNTTGEYTTNFSSALTSSSYTISGSTNTYAHDSAMCTFGPRASTRTGSLTDYTSSAVRFNLGGKYNYASSSDGTFVGMQAVS